MTKEERTRTKNYLYSAINLNKEIGDILERKDMLMSRVMNPSINYGNEKVQTSGNGDMLGDAIAEIRDLEAEADRLVDEYVDLKGRIKEEIAFVKVEKYRSVLVEKYIYEKKNSEIADGNGIPYQTCCSRIRKGEEEFYSIHKHNI